MTYPALLLTDETSAEVMGGHEPARATNGALRVRKLWPVDKMRFSLVHHLTRAELATLRAYYAANALATVSFTWPLTGVVHQCRFVAPLQVEPRGAWRRVRVQLEEE